MAWNLKNSATFCQNTEVKPSKIWFSLENQVPLPFFCNFAIFGAHFHQLFATDIRWSLEKFDFLRKISDFYQFCHFRSPFSPTFRHGPKVKPWKIWFLDFLSILSKSKSNFQNFLPQGAWSLENFEKNSWLPAEIELLPVEIPRKLVIFWKPETEIGFIWHFRWKNPLPFPVFSIFAIFGPQFHQLFATDIRCTKKNLRKKITSGEKSTSVSCFSLG